MKWIAKWIGCMLYIGCATYFVAAGPGLQYDEALLAHGAAHILYGRGIPPIAHEDRSWIPLGGKGFPLMVISYVGAVEDYVLLPLMALFGTSAAVVRAGSILMTSALVLSGSCVLHRHCGPAAAIVFGCVTGLQPTFIAATTYDDGAVAQWMLPLGLLIFALDAFANAPDAKRAFTAGMAAGFAMWSRANCVWFIAAIAVAAALLYGRELLRLRRLAVPMLIGGCVGAAPFIVFQVASHGAIVRFARSAGAAPHIGARLQALADVLVMAGEQQRIWNGSRVAPWEVAVVAVLAIVSVATGIASRDRFRRATAFVAVLTTALMLVSTTPIAQHHLVGVVPLVAACAAGTAAAAWHRSIGRVAVVAGAAAYAVIAILSIARAGEALRASGGVDAWSDAIDAVVSDPSARNADILDWGLYNNLYVLGRTQTTGRELFWAATERFSGRGLSWAAEVARGGAYMIPAWQTFPEARRGFLAALRDSGAPCRVTHFHQRNGRPYADLFIVTGRVPPSPLTPHEAESGSRARATTRTCTSGRSAA